MEKFSLKYGKEVVEIRVPKKNLLGVIQSEACTLEKKTEEEVIREALANPIQSEQLRDIVKKGEKVCVIISDITRAWQKMSTFLPYIIEELNEGGVEDGDITILCATGSHRGQTKEEHSILLGPQLAERFEVIDHDCRDKENMVYLGETTYGTPVWINKKAMACDHIVLTGAIVYHDLAGWAGGKKSIVPGISSYETIMANHSLSLSTEVGGGINPLIGCGKAETNPIHHDMLQGAALAKPSFLFNVIIGGDGNIAHGVAGDFIKAHEVGCKLVEEMDAVNIKEQADLLIASAGGYPKDIDLYQSSKALSNGKEAVKKGGTMIVLCQCVEGVGHPEVQEIIAKYKNNLERELELRENYTISKFSGYLVTNAAEAYDIILVSDIAESLVSNANIRVVKTLEEALNIVYREKGSNLQTYIMPFASNTLPKLMK